jgi:membrane-bound lytic murein transglycosylase A
VHSNLLARSIPIFIALVFCTCKKQEPPLVDYPHVRPLVLNDSLLRLPPPPRALSKAMFQIQPDSMWDISFDRDFFKALHHQQTYLKRRDVDRYPVQGIHKDELEHVTELLQASVAEPPGALLNYFDFYQINTELKKDRVRITGYYTPIMEVGRTQSGAFPTPLYARPESNVPSPAAIEAGALAGRGLELGWAKSKRERANAQLQGSCMIEFPDNDRDFLGFGGSVKGDGGTFVFFKKINKEVLGSGSFPLTAGYSAAIDPNFIPIGAVLLAELPICDKAGNVVGYRHQIIFAQDRGGAIKTTKRMDLYCGIGKKGLDAAKRVNSYGRLWLMLPKRF